jgi:hypothetical protein
MFKYSCFILQWLGVRLSVSMLVILNNVLVVDIRMADPKIRYGCFLLLVRISKIVIHTVTILLDVYKSYLYS